VMSRAVAGKRMETHNNVSQRHAAMRFKFTVCAS
jgi:hypothetical protein